MDLKPSFLIGHTEVRHSPLLLFTLGTNIGLEFWVVSKCERFLEYQFI